MDIKELLNAVRSGRCSVDEAAAQIKQQNFDDLGFAKLDYQRRQRTGGGETIYCPGKNLEQLAEIVRNFHARALPMLGTRCSREQFEFLQQFDLPLEYDAVSKILVLSQIIPTVTIPPICYLKCIPYFENAISSSCLKANSFISFTNSLKD